MTSQEALRTTSAQGLGQPGMAETAKGLQHEQVEYRGCGFRTWDAALGTSP